jgi:Right handed beta helix region
MASSSLPWRKWMRKLLIMSLMVGCLGCAVSALAQTTQIYTGTIKDLSGAAVTSGQVTFTLALSNSATIPGTGTFVPTSINCNINSDGSLSGFISGVVSGPCIVTANISLTPTGTSYRICEQPGYSTPGSCFYDYALGGTKDISSIIPTLTTGPLNYGGVPGPPGCVIGSTCTGALLLAPTTGQAIVQPANTDYSITASGTGKERYNGNEVLTTGTGVQSSASANQPLVQAAGTSFNPNIVNSVVYANNYATVQLAITAACNGSLPGSVVLPVGTLTLTASLTIPSNCSISGQGGRRSTLQANSTLSAPLVTLTSASNVRLANFGIDGNRSLNTNVFDGIDITASSNVVLDGVNVSNFNNNGVLVYATSSHIIVQNGEIYQNGPANPGSQGTAGIAVAGGAVKDVSVTNNFIHDNSTGVEVVNSPTTGQDVSGVSVSGNRIYSNANDAFIVSTTTLTGGNIVNVRAENNEIYCNGWPANGTGFSPRCTPGFMQSGSVASQGGVGIDLIQQGSSSIVRPVVVGNVIHDNVFEGISPTTNIVPIVNTAGTAVTWVSGPHFNTGMHAGENILINGAGAIVASVSSTTAMTVQTSVGTQTGVAMNLPGYMGAIISGNDVSLSGSGSVGPCYYNQFSDGNIYLGNIATKCNLSGFENFYSSYLTYTDDKAYSNDLSGTTVHNAGFTNLGGYSVSFINVATDDPQTVPTQTIGIRLDGTTSNSFIHSSSLFAAIPLTDLSGGATTTSIINGSYVSQLPLSTAAPSGTCGLTPGLTGSKSAYSACLEPYIIQRVRLTTNW